MATGSDHFVAPMFITRRLNTNRFSAPTAPATARFTAMLPPSMVRLALVSRRS